MCLVTTFMNGMFGGKKLWIFGNRGGCDENGSLSPLSALFI